MAKASVKAIPKDPYAARSPPAKHFGLTASSDAFD
jgi:hypothetical protein